MNKLIYLYVKTHNITKLKYFGHTRKADRGYKHSEETIARLSAVNRGRKHSEETKAKISSSTKGRKVSEETRNRLSIFNKGKKHTEETKAKMRGRPATVGMTGKRHTEEAKAKALATKKRKRAEKLALAFNNEIDYRDQVPPALERLPPKSGAPSFSDDGGMD